MSTFAIYRLSDGQIVSHFTGTPRLLKRNTPPGHAAIVGRLDARTQRIDPETGEVVESKVAAADWERRELRALTLQQIAELERRQNRPLRELQIDPRNVEAAQRLAEIEADIAKLREGLK